VEACANALDKEVKAMVRTVNAVSDRLLGLVVPRVTAHADPCGEYYRDCTYCSAGYRLVQFCCRTTGACGSCYRVVCRG
jgi:hypothetical protein